MEVKLFRSKVSSTNVQYKRYKAKGFQVYAPLYKVQFKFSQPPTNAVFVLNLECTTVFVVQKYRQTKIPRNQKNAASWEFTSAHARLTSNGASITGCLAL